MSNNKNGQKSPKKNNKVSKFFEHICNISDQERKDIVDFARLSISESTSNDADLLEIFLDKLDVNETEETIWSKVSPKKKIKNLKQIKGRLFKTLQRYAAMYQMEQNPHLKNALLTKYYTKAGLQKNMKAIYRATESEITEAQDDFELPIYTFWLHKTHLESKKGKRAWNDNTFEMLEQLNHFYNRNYLRLMAASITQLRILSNTPEQLREDILSEVPRRIKEFEEQEESLPAIEQLYLHLLKMVNEKQKVHFDTVKEKLKILRKELSPAVIEETEGHLLNFCARRINTADDDTVVQHYAREYLVLKADLGKMPFLDKGGQIIHQDFKNIVAIGIISNDFDWTYDFIKKYNNKIYDADKPKHQSFLDLIEALVKLYDNKLGDAQDALSKYDSADARYDDDFYKIMRDKILLKILYESAKNVRKDAFLSKIEACKRKVKRNIDGKRKQLDVNFLKILRDLYNNKPITLDVIRQQVTHIDYIWFKRVLQKKGRAVNK